MTQLSGKQIGAFIDALLDAYPTRDTLRIMVRIELEESLDAITDGANQRVVVFNLITWAERSGRLDDLVAGAVKQNPGNPALRALNLTPSPANAVQTRPTASAPFGPAAIDIFLAYSHYNLDAMRTVEADLRDARFSVWTDEGLEAGTPIWTAAIEEAVAQAPVMVVLLSPAAKKSAWVENEVALAQLKGKRIFPILVEGDVGSAMPFRLISAQWVDGRQELAQAVQRVLAQMGARGLPATPVTPIKPDSTTAPDPVRMLRMIMQDRCRPAKERLDAGLRLSDLGVLPEGLDDFIAVTGTDFRIGKYPVTNYQFRRFVDTGGYVSRGAWWSEDSLILRRKMGFMQPYFWHDTGFNRATQPVVGITWYEAEAYCAWLNHANHVPSGYRAQLPTREQWMLAAQNGRKQAASEVNYPWGGVFDPALANTEESGLGQTTPVDMYQDGVTPEGVFDLVGNVWEWTDDRYDGANGAWWLKGGSYYSDAAGIRVSAADWDFARVRLSFRGCRVVMVPISSS